MAPTMIRAGSCEQVAGTLGDADEEVAGEPGEAEASSLVVVGAEEGVRGEAGQGRVSFNAQEFRSSFQRLKEGRDVAASPRVLQAGGHRSFPGGMARIFFPERELEEVSWWVVGQVMALVAFDAEYAVILDILSMGSKTWTSASVELLSSLRYANPLKQGSREFVALSLTDPDAPSWWHRPHGFLRGTLTGLRGGRGVFSTAEGELLGPTWTSKDHYALRGKVATLYKKASPVVANIVEVVKWET